MYSSVSSVSSSNLSILHRKSMRNSAAYRIYCCLQHRGVRKICSSSTVFSRIHEHDPPSKPEFHGIPGRFKASCVSPKTSSCFASITACRGLHNIPSVDSETHLDPDLDLIETSVDYDGEVEDYGGEVEDYSGAVEPIELWEDEDEAEPKIGDGANGGGVVLNNCPWGEKALSLAQDVLREFGEEMQLFAFKASPRGYIYVRLEDITKEYGCPRMEEIESFSRQYKKMLEDEIPDDLALEVSSPGADRLLRVPDDLLRFKDMAMVVKYLECSDARSEEKEKVYFLDSIETEEQCCVWKLADVKENRDPAAKGKPLNRKQKDAKVKLPYDTIKSAKFYIT